jgi:hypothetical protein
MNDDSSTSIDDLSSELEEEVEEMNLPADSDELLIRWAHSDDGDTSDDGSESDGSDDEEDRFSIDRSTFD